jgi:DNA-binding GntR family transcriptional regulator
MIGRAVESENQATLTVPARPGSLPRRRRNLKDDVVAVLVEDIMGGRMKPGDRINQDEICERLGISRLPVREALIALESSGLVHNPPRQGSFVAQITPGDVLDHFAIFGVVSGLATQYAVDNLTADELDQQRELLRQMHKAREPSVALELNFKFHRVIHTAGTSYRLRSQIRGLLKVIPEALFAGGEWGPQSEADHAKILDALVARDRDSAFAAAERHLRRSGERAVQMLTESGFWS